MTASDSKLLNQVFADHLDTPEGLEKLGEVGGNYIQQKLRETSFARQIIPPLNVTVSDVTRSVDHDGFVKIIDKEPDSAALAINFLGEPAHKYLSGERYQVNFYRIASDLFSKDETELLAYNYPVTKVIEQNSVKDIQTIEDTNFLTAVDAAITISGYSSNVTGTSQKLNKTALKTLINLVEGTNTAGEALKVETLLMGQKTWNDLLEWNNTLLGNDLLGEVTKDGYTYKTLLGRKVVVSIKNDLFVSSAKPSVYAFAAPQFLGNFFILNQTKFVVKKDFNIISFKGWEDIAMGIGNVRGTARITLDT
jgi:hypothetical protein